RYGSLAVVAGPHVVGSRAAATRAVPTRFMGSRVGRTLRDLGHQWIANAVCGIGAPGLAHGFSAVFRALHPAPVAIAVHDQVARGDLDRARVVARPARVARGLLLVQDPLYVESPAFLEEGAGIGRQGRPDEESQPGSESHSRQQLAHLTPPDAEKGETV